MSRPSASGTVSLRHFVQLGLILILSLFIALVFASLFQADRLGSDNTYALQTTQVQSRLKDIQLGLLLRESGARGYFYTGEQKYLHREGAVGDSLRSALEDTRALLHGDAEQTERLGELERMVRERSEELEDEIDLKRTGREVQLRSTTELGEGRQKSEAIFEQIQRMILAADTQLQDRKERSRQAEGALQIILLGGLAVAVAIGARLIQTMGRRLGPLDEAVHMAEQIARGDLTTEPLKVYVGDEVGKVGHGLNRMLFNLQRLIRRVLTSADALNESTSKIAAAARDQALATQQQFTALQETSGTMEGLTQSAAQVVERAREVASRDEATAAASRHGQEAVQKSVRATQAIVEQVLEVSNHMASLSLKTQAIRDVVLSVNDIAERSNVLALNASILAAGAGPEGKSFAVVANEMKSLAEQSKEATTVVRSLLGDVERNIQVSVALTEEAQRRAGDSGSHTDGASEAILQLADHVEHSVQAFGQIAAATRQQSVSFEQVSQALRSIRQASQQSAVNTGLLEGASRELHRLSGEMLAVISPYRVVSEGKGEGAEERAPASRLRETESGRLEPVPVRQFPVGPDPQPGSPD